MNDFDNKQICLYKDINRLGFTCDVCGRKVNGCRYINGMSFCEKCYQETFGKDNQQNEMQQLKQQLAEKDIRIEELEGQFAYECECNKQLVELQKQLEEKQNTIDEINKEFVQAVHDWKALCAEKDKEIEKLKQRYTILENENGKLTTELIMDKYKKAQKEVSFGKQLAIQELEKVKNGIKHFCDIHSDEYYGVKSQVKGIEQDVCESIDYQIKVLKGE